MVEALSKGYRIHEKYNIKQFPAVLVINQKEDGTAKVITYEGEFLYIDLEMFLSDYASPHKIIPKESDRAKGSLPANPLEGLTPPKDRPKPLVKDFAPERFEEIVLGTEGMVMIHVFEANKPHEAFDNLAEKFQK